jgi:hypothetical protein
MKASMRLCVKFCDANQVRVHAVLLTHTNPPFHSAPSPAPKNKTLINNCQNFHDAQKMQIVSEEWQDAFG